MRKWIIALLAALLALFAGATYTIAETHPVSRLPEATGVVGASWRFLTYLHLDADVEYSSSMYAYTVRSADPADLAKVPCFWTANIRLACDLKAFSPLDGEVYVATHGEYNAANGTDADDKRGIEKVNVSKKKSELYISGKDLGGGVASIAVEDGVIYAAIKIFTIY